MRNKIDFLVDKIRSIFNISENDAQIILAGITILSIAISWFIMGGVVVKKDVKLSEEEI